MSARVLLVDDDESLRRVTSYHLEQAGYTVSSCESAERALEKLAGHAADVVVTDLRMPGLDGLELLRRVKKDWPELGVVMITAHGAVEDAVAAMQAGAHDYLVKPFEHEALRLSVEKTLRLTELVRENERLRGLAERELRFESLVATSASMKELLRTAAQVAPRDTTVLLLGESGTGKELLARALHHASARREGPFVAVNVGALPDSLIDSELFGHRKGAFTGADQARKGRFELAHGGTLFLDEIGDLRTDLQVKLLRALQEGEIEPLGSTAPVGVDVRVIAATHRDLEAMVRAGEFREDLFYRLHVLPLHLPPLRDRKDDIPPLALHFARRLAGDQAPEFLPETLALLHRYDWPGNVRELENVVERAWVLHPEGPIGPEDLPARLRETPERPHAWIGPLPDEGLDLEAVEREILARALEKCGGNQSRTARFLNITRNTLLYRMEKYGLRS